MFSRRAQRSSASDARQRAAAAGHPAGSALPGGEPPGYSGDRSCCCPARPQVKVIMPPAAGRPHTTDLWLCGHHYRQSRAALEAAGATVIDLTRPAAGA